MNLTEQIYILNDFYKWANEHNIDTNWIAKEDVQTYVAGLRYDLMDEYGDLLEVQNIELQIEEFLTKLFKDTKHYCERLN